MARRTRHTTLIPTARRVHAALTAAGWRPHPGPIDPRGGRGGALRVKINADPGRTRIRVSGGGVQELYMYGPVDLQQVRQVLASTLGEAAIEAVVMES
ncbi:MAG: hypothetical protein H7831_12035 [Magnetococcus sp. WYHC-3]